MTVELDHIRVQDAMHRGIMSCSAETPLGEVAGIMARHRMHAVAVIDYESSRPMGVVSDLDVIGAIAGGEEASAAQAAGTEPVTVASDERLHRAAQLMAEHGVAHLVVIDAVSGHPVGVLSTLDIAAVYADGRS